MLIFTRLSLHTPNQEKSGVLANLKPLPDSDMALSLLLLVHSRSKE